MCHQASLTSEQTVTKGGHATQRLSLLEYRIEVCMLCFQVIVIMMKVFQGPLDHRTVYQRACFMVWWCEKRLILVMILLMILRNMV